MLNRKPLRKQKIEEKDRFPKNVSGKSHSAENPKESSIVAKSFVSSNNPRGSDENKLENSRIVPKNASLKNKIRI